MSFIDTSVTGSAATKQLQPTSSLLNISTTEINKGLTQAADYESKASAYLKSAIQSTFSTFDKSAKSLSSGISTQLAGIFNNTNVASASTIPTSISDPISTNLLSSRKPGSTAFKIDGLQAGSQAIVSSGNSVTRGSGSGLMSGTSVTTLINRLKVDVSAIKNLPNTIAGRFSTQKLNGLFSTTGNLTNVTGGLGKSLLGSLISPASVTALAGTLGVPLNKINVSANDFQSFSGRVSPLSAALGNKDLSGYYTSNPNYSLTDASGTPVYTNRSGVDSTTANSILGVIHNLGCSVRTNEYRSSSELDSLFGLGLILSALKGMEDLVDDLLNCSHSTSQLGQASLGRAFTEVSGSQIGIAKSIIDRVDAPSRLNSADLSFSILTNQSLAAKDKATVDSIFDTLGTSTKSAMSLSSVSSDRYPVYNGSVIPKIQTSFTNTVFADSTLSDYFKGRQLVVGKDGNLVYA